MITRRRFTGLIGAAAMAAPHVARAQALPVVRLGNAAGLIDTQVIFLTMGQHPRLNYYEEEGCRMDILNMSGVGQTIQAVASGNCDTSAISPVAFLNVYAKTPNLDIVFPYCWLRQAHWSVAVKPDSPVKSLAELKGKTVGIRNQGDTGYFGARAMFRELGIDPDKDVDWVSIGEGGPAGEAIYRGRADAMAFWDGSFARIEIAGFPLRQLPNSPGMGKLFGNCYGVRRSTFAKDRDLYVRFFRAMAKGTVFSRANPELALRVRIGLNAGEPIADRELLFGAAVNLAARICARARGGQILVADVVRHLAAGKGVNFVDRGRARLKGFRSRFRLFEVPWQNEG